MNPAEECLKCLQNKDWIRLSIILSDNKNAGELAESPTFSIFENILIDELKRHENDSSEDLHQVATRIFQIHENKESLFNLSQNVLLKIAKYLFDKRPNEKYAKVLKQDLEALQFLKIHKQEIQDRIDNDRISGNLNIKVGIHGKPLFEKEIFNSPQEKELFLAAKKILSSSILLPNTALSTIIDSKVCELLAPSITTFFYKSTLDLCVVNSQTFKPELFIELDSSWHDKPRNIENDKKKDEIFKAAGLKLNRLRKKENVEMIEIFELFIKRNYPSQQP